jgi:hypothetical protein
MVRARTIELAWAYVDRHFYRRYLFPIKPGAKFPPTIKDNLNLASNDPEQLRLWEEKWPGCNWGVSHSKSELMVIDVDTNPKKGKVGQKTYDGHDLVYGWPATEMTTTPSGGFHLVYEGWANEDHPAHINALGENGVGKDIDSPNYTLIPGCTFDDGTSYVGNDAEAVKCPEWIYDVIKKAKTKSRITNAGEVVVELDQQSNIDLAVDFLQNDAVPSIQGQGGDLNLLKTAYYLKDLGISQQLGAEMLNEYYNPRCEPPWDMEDLEKKMAGAYSYANLSKVGGKTAEADFGDDPPEPPPRPTTPAARKARQEAKKAAKVRADARLASASLPPDQRERIWTKEEVIAEWVYIKGLERFILKSDTKIVWKTTAFDKAFAYIPTKKEGKSLSEFLLRQKKGTIPRFDDAIYQPGKPPSIDGRFFNLYVQPDIQPLEGDLSWWDAHLEYLLPNPVDRNHLLNWMAWFVQNIGKKPKHAILLQGEKQGTGKSFIVEMLGRVINRRNVSNINQADLHGDFNGWAIRSKLLVIEELRAVDRSEVANKLHPLITQEVISVNEKNLPQRDVENCFGIFAMSNHDAAITLDQSDRRYLVINTPAAPRDPAYYSALYAKLFDPTAVAAVAYALQSRALGAYDGAAAAPLTEAKGAMIEAGLSDLEHFMRDKSGEFPLNGRIISVEDVIQILPRRLEGRSARLHSTIKSILKSRFKGEDIGQFTLSDRSRPRLMVINGTGLRNFEGWRDRVAKQYEDDKARAGKNMPLDDGDSGEEFREPA